MSQKPIFEKGDIIMLPFKNNRGVWVRKQPMVVVSISNDGEIVTSWDQRAIAAAIVMSEENSALPEDLLASLDAADVIFENVNNGIKKRSIFQLNAANFLASDLLTSDFKGQLAPDLVDDAIHIIEKLSEHNLLVINKVNLPATLRPINGNISTLVKENL